MNEERIVNETKYNILKRTIRSNGYGCSCCGETREDSKWVSVEEMMNFTQIVEKALEHNLGDGIVGIKYEKEGRELYGYWAKGIYRLGTDVYILFDGYEYMICSSVYASNCISKEEIMKSIGEKIFNKEKS